MALDAKKVFAVLGGRIDEIDGTAAKEASEKAREYAENAETSATSAKNDADRAEQVAESIPSDYTEMSNDVSELKDTTSQLSESIADIQEDTFLFFGNKSNHNISIVGSATKKELLKADLTKESMYKIDVAFNSPTTKNSYLYLLDSDGNSIIPNGGQQIVVGSLNKTINVNVLNNYVSAYVALTCSESLSIRSVSISTTNNGLNDIKNSIDDLANSNKIQITPSNGNILSILNENNEYSYPHIYYAESIEYKTNASRWCGVETIVKNPPISSIIYVRANRSIGNDKTIRLNFFDANNTRIGSENWSTTSEISCVVPFGTDYCRVTIAACWDTALGSDVIVTFSDVAIKYGDISEIRDKIDGVGNHSYIGEKITIDTNDAEHFKCNINKWKSIVDSDETYKAYLNQSIAIFNDVLFMFNDHGTGFAVDYNTKEIISTFIVENVYANHLNSAQFTKIYYSDSDSYPLLMISRCGSDGDDSCQLFRVTRNGNQFSFELINKISTDIKTYGFSWGIDNATNIIYGSSNKNGDYTVTTDNPICYYGWGMPNIEDIKSGTEIVLKKEDRLFNIETEFSIPQGLSVKNGSIFHAVQTYLDGGNRPYIWRIDTVRGRRASVIPLLGTYEPEGVCIYNGKLYVSQKHGNSVDIYEFSF